VRMKRSKTILWNKQASACSSPQLPPNNALHPSLDPARLALPLQAVCVKRG
jgi:hypothetical protein